jgi:hypothetical protein
MSESDKPRKFRIKDLAAGIVAIVIGIILIVVRIIYGQYVGAHHFYAAWIFDLIAAVFIIIGLAYFGWKIYRIKKGRKI